jgi:hypothetical protein
MPKVAPVKESAEVKDAVMAKALHDYVNTGLSLQEIATTANRCPATVTVWAKKAGIKLRGRGRNLLEEPTAFHKKIIDLESILTYEEVGRRMGITKQEVARIIKRWHNWKKPHRPPFEPGDVILWRKEKLTVMDAGIQTGTVVDSRGKIFRCFTWNTGGKLPKKVGVNKKYVVHSNGEPESVLEQVHQ